MAYNNGLGNKAREDQELRMEKEVNNAIELHLALDSDPDRVIEMIDDIDTDNIDEILDTLPKPRFYIEYNHPDKGRCKGSFGSDYIKNFVKRLTKLGITITKLVRQSDKKVLVHKTI